jgi:hypothetical protein
MPAALREWSRRRVGPVDTPPIPAALAEIQPVRSRLERRGDPKRRCGLGGRHARHAVEEELMSIKTSGALG